MVEAAGKFTLDKKVLDEEIAKEKEWNKVIIADHEGKVITTKNLTTIAPEEIKLATSSQDTIDSSWDVLKIVTRP